MPTLTIRNVETGVHRYLRKRAADHGCSMEEEVRQILRREMEVGQSSPGTVARRIHDIFAPMGGADDLADALPVRTKTAPKPMAFKE